MRLNMKYTLLVSIALLALALIATRGIAEDAQLMEEGIQQLETEISSVEERRLIVQLREKKQKNEEEAQALKKERNELNLLRFEVDKKLDELQLLRKEVQGLLAEKDVIELAKIQELSQMYNKMDPAKAAQIISSLGRELAIGILSGMKSKSAGKVLANIGGEQAAALSTAYSTLRED
jgi:flagellar motility protein MotE (MotC chaperone)